MDPAFDEHATAGRLGDACEHGAGVPMASALFIWMSDEHDTTIGAARIRQRVARVALWVEEAGRTSQARRRCVPG